MGIRAIAAFVVMFTLCMLLIVLLAGCSTMETRHNLYVEHIEIINSQQICVNSDRCIQKSMYLELPLCKIFTLPNPSHAEVGKLLRDCIN